MRRAMRRVGATIACVVWGFAGVNPKMVAQEAAVADSALEEAIDRGLDFLRESGQAEDGPLLPGLAESRRVIAVPGPRTSARSITFASSRTLPGHA